MPTISSPNILTDPGYLFWAPLGTTMPTNTVSGSKYTDAWAAAWIPLGATENGSQLTYSSTVEAINVAELFDPVRYATTARSGNMAFNLADYTLANWKRAMNGGAMTLVSGTGATALTSFSPPAPGSETRVMIGWESLDSTLRLFCYQTLQGGEVASAFRKAPSMALIPCQFNFEVPSSGKPFELFSAGIVRSGTVF